MIPEHDCLLLEDSLNDQLAVEMVMDKFPNIHLQIVKSPKDFLEAIRKNSYSLFIVDIDLGESLTGIDMISMLNDTKAWVIISSSSPSSEYFEQYSKLNLNTFYLQKPIDEFALSSILQSFQRTTQASADVTESPSNQQNETVVIRQGNYMYRIAVKDIIYIETSNHDTIVYTSNSKFSTYTSLKNFEDFLKNHSFEKINRNTLVNMQQVSRINIKDCFVEIGELQLPISRASKQTIMTKYLNIAF